MQKSARFFTIGCKVNQYETQAIREAFLKNGYREADSSQPADIFVINTCTVTSKADKDSRRLIRLSHRINPDAQIIVTGCLVEKDGDEIRAIPGVTHIMKNSQKHRIADLYFGTDVRPKGGHGITEIAPGAYTPLKISDFHNRTRAFVKIQDGCNNFCSYCKVPYVRGRSRSRDLQNIIDEVNRLVDRGFKELVLCGICLGEWGRDLPGNPELADVIDKVSSIKKDFRIRLSSIEPRQVGNRLIRIMADSRRLCNHLHIPLQSGDNGVLKLMNRPYSSRDFVKLIGRIKKTIPDFSLTTDVLVGFPGENKKAFFNTIKVLKNVRPSRLHIFSYSKRNGTKAYNYNLDVSKEEMKERKRRLEGIDRRFSYEYRRRFFNKTTQVLVENKRDKFTQLLTGYSDTYIRLLFTDGPDSFYGQLKKVKITKVDLKSTFCIS